MTDSKVSLAPDIIRVISIIFVVTTHVYSSSLNVNASPNLLTFINLLIQTLCKLGVPLFIMLSGYLLLASHKKESPAQFYQKRLARIGLPLLFWPLFYYAGFILVDPRPFSIPAFINDYLFLNTYFHLYFLFIMAGLYFITPYLRMIFFNLSQPQKQTLAIAALIFSAGLTPLVYFTFQRLNYWSILTVFIPFIGYFLAGDAFRNIQLTTRQQRHILAGIGFLLLLATFGKFVAIQLVVLDLYKYLNDVLSVLAIPTALLTFVTLIQPSFSHWVEDQKRLTKSVALISPASFGMYLIHPILMYGAGRIVGHQVFSIPYFLIVFGGSLAIVLIARRIPYVRGLVG